MPHLDTVYALYRPLIKANESEQKQSILSSPSIVSSASVIAFRDEIEEAWRHYFYKTLICPDSIHMQLVHKKLLFL